VVDEESKFDPSKWGGVEFGGKVSLACVACQASPFQQGLGFMESRGQLEM
jgi:hypothetical protein